MITDLLARLQSWLTPDVLGFLLILAGGVIFAQWHENRWYGTRWREAERQLAVLRPPLLKARAGVAETAAREAAEVN